MNAIELRDVGFGYGTELLFDRFALAVAPGEFLGVIGPNGSGKSTLLRLMAGLLRPASGSVLVQGQDLVALARRAVARELAVVPQESHFAFDFRVEDVVMMGRNPFLGRWDRPSAADRAAVRRAMARVDVGNLAGKSVNEVSGGEKQRVVLARALAQEPGILLLDEPTAQLDIGHQHSFLRVLGELNREGRTIVFSTHDLNLAAANCSRLVLLDHGKVAADGPAELVLEAGLVGRVYGVEPVITRHPATGRPQVLLPADERPEPAN